MHLTAATCPAGIIIGLAIYNSHILEFTFPHAMYKKLLDRPLGLADLESVHPEICSSLRRLLAYPAAQVEQDMALTFQVRPAADRCESATVLALLGLLSVLRLLPVQSV